MLPPSQSAMDMLRIAHNTSQNILFATNYSTKYLKQKIIWSATSGADDVSCRH